MLPDIPKIKKRFHKQCLVNQVMRSSFKGKVITPNSNLYIHEGKEIILTDEDGNEMEVTLHNSSVEITIDAKDIESVDYENILKKYSDAAITTAEQVNKSLFDDLRKVAESTGNLHDAKGKPFTTEEFLKMLEKTNLYFDENGECQIDVCAGKDLHEVMTKTFSELEKNPDEKAKFEEQFSRIIKKKKEEWYARESNRKLVD